MISLNLKSQFNIIRSKIKDLLNIEIIYRLKLDNNIRFSNKNHISRQWINNKNITSIHNNEIVYEESISNLLINKSKDKHTFYDIGTMCGYYSLLLSKFYKNIYAFDIIEKCVNECKFQIKLNKIKNIEVFNKAIGSGELINFDFYLEKNQMKSILLDNFAATKNSSFDNNLIKIDIEGYEESALDGMYNFLKGNNNEFLIAIHQNLMPKGNSFKNIYKKLKEFGYNIFIVEDKLSIVDINIKKSLFEIFCTRK